MDYRFDIIDGCVHVWWDQSNLNGFQLVSEWLSLSTSQVWEWLGQMSEAKYHRIRLRMILSCINYLACALQLGFQITHEGLPISGLLIHIKKDNLLPPDAVEFTMIPTQRPGWKGVAYLKLNLLKWGTRPEQQVCHMIPYWLLRRLFRHGVMGLPVEPIGFRIHKTDVIGLPQPLSVCTQFWQVEI